MIPKEGRRLAETDFALSAVNEACVRENNIKTRVDSGHFEPLQQEQMVLQYVEKHGRITRREAAELCHLSGPQAYRMLQRLVEKGDIRQVGGRGRGVKYERESK